MSDFKPSPRRGTRIKKAPPLVLGYTRTGKDVVRPTRAADTDIDTSWTREDHKDAAYILKSHGERESDRTIAAWCTSWAKVHKALGGR